jgi:radical SAM/Cys-rich protein
MIDAGSADAAVHAHDFDAHLQAVGVGPLRRGATTTLQINLGKRCNQACTHCHVEAGPLRTENMDGRVVDRVLALMAAMPDLALVDLTGGAPELNPHFRRLVRAARAGGVEVIDRCNLTVLSEPGQADTAQFLADQGVHVVASMPCHSQANVDKQRGGGVFARSITGIRALNALGYGRAGSGLQLDLVYNPGGAFLPPATGPLEADYKERLAKEHGLVFNSLLTLTNMPIKRFADQLRLQGDVARYMALLVDNFNPATVPGLMCRSLLSIGWDGQLYDCDFNQMLELPLGAAVGTVFEVDDVRALLDKPVTTADHCFGCTAGAGSSCGGALDTAT